MIMIFTPLDNLLMEPDEQVSWVWDGILPTGGLSLIAAKPKTGKSTIARQLSHCVVQGLDFLGRKTEEGPVLYCAFEEKRGEVKRYFRLMGTQGPLYSYINVAPADTIKRLEQAIVDNTPMLVIIDTLMKLCRVNDGNSYTEVIGAIEPLLKLGTPAQAFCVCIICQREIDKGVTSFLAPQAYLPVSTR